MKHCPTCHTTYADETLKFCRIDGEALASGSAPFHESQTSSAKLSERNHDLIPTEILSSKELTTGSLPAAAMPATRRKQSSRKAINSIAILPLANACADPNGEYLSDGITESLINSISQLPAIRVLPRSTVFRFKGREVDPQAVGRELGVRAVLTGRVCQIGETLIVQADLVDVVNDAQLWGEHYKRKMTDIFDVQEEIAREITEKLRLKLTSEQKKRLNKRYTVNPEAYQAYLKGRYYWNKRTEDGLKRSTHYFQQAVEIDPAYALAYAGLADSYALPGIAEYGLLPPKEAMPKAKAAAMKALEIDKTLAEAQTTLAHVRAFYDWDWAGAEQEFKRAI